MWTHITYLRPLHFENLLTYLLSMPNCHDSLTYV